MHGGGQAVDTSVPAARHMREQGLTVVLVKAHEQKLVLLLAREVHYAALATQWSETAAAGPAESASGRAARQIGKSSLIRVKRICSDTPFLLVPGCS